MITTLIQQTKTELIYGPAGKLEVKILATAVPERSAWGIVCHPHPLHGGTMYNKVVTTLAKTFQGLGIHTVCFNFRGVGKSEGEFDQGEGELEDLLAVIDWVQKQRATRELWLAGFSFGAAIAAKAATQIVVNQLVTVAPPVQYFRMQQLPSITCPWILVQGEKDEVVPAEAVFAFAASRNPKPFIIRFPEAGHFFHGQLSQLRTQLEEALIKKF